MQEIWEKQKRESAVPLLEVPQDFLGRETAGKHVFADGESNPSATTSLGGVLYPQHGEDRGDSPGHDSPSPGRGR